MGEASDSSEAAVEVKQSVFLMRHGARHDSMFPHWKTTASRPYDTPLSKHGHFETPRLVRQRLAGKVSGHSNTTTVDCILLQDIHAVISSPFLRCLQTATHAYTALGLSGLHTCNLLSEMLLPGNDMTETPAVPATEDVEDTVFLSLDSSPLPPFPEERNACYTRYKQALDMLADQFWPQNLLLVTHQGCVQEAVRWGGRQIDVEAIYCAHVHLSRTSQHNYNWVWREDAGIYTYETIIE